MKGGGGAVVSAPAIKKYDQMSALALVGTPANLNETVLKSLTIPANTLNADRRSIRIRAWGRKAGNVNSVTVRIRFGTVTLAGTIIANIAATAVSAAWAIEVELFRTGTGAQWSVARNLFNATTPTVTQITPAIDETQAILVEVTGQNTVANANDVEAIGLSVEYVDAP